MLTTTVSGSFHRFMPDIETAVHELGAAGVHVLSPAYPKVVDHIGEFLFVASDRVRSIRLVQDRHLDCIEASDFLWLVCPGGYVGQSGSMELGFAVAKQVPVFTTDLPSDLTLRQYVRQVDSFQHAIRFATEHGRQKPETFLLDPHASIESAHKTLEDIRKALNKSPNRIGEAVAREIYTNRRLVGRLVGGRN
jgi:hypothetical protein